MSEITIGQLIRDPNAQRDAIHVAVLPVIAGEDWMRPGEEVGFVYGSTDTVKRMDRCYGLPAVGVVDPFLTESVNKGQRFWLFLYPNTVTGMRHHWSHPAIDAPPVQRGEAEEWLRRFADEWNFDFDEMVAAATASVDDSFRYITARGRDLHGASELDPGDEAAFWRHIEMLTGKHIDEKHREGVCWTCTC